MSKKLVKVYTYPQGQFFYIYFLDISVIDRKLTGVYAARQHDIKSRGIMNKKSRLRGDPYDKAIRHRSDKQNLS